MIIWLSKCVLPDPGLPNIIKTKDGYKIPFACGCNWIPYIFVVWGGWIIIGFLVY